MKNKKFLVGFSVLSLAGMAVAAAPNAISSPAGKSMKADTDGNKILSKAEAIAAAEARFTKMDASGDGQIDASDRVARVKQKFATMDSNSDGSISEAEFVAADAARRSKGGERMSGPGRRGGGYVKGNLSDKGGMQSLTKADSNSDKKLSRDEYIAAAAERFAKADTNADGNISATERQAARITRRAERDERGQRGRQPMPGQP